MTYRITHLDATGLRVCASRDPLSHLADALNQAKTIPADREPRIRDDHRELTIERAAELLAE